MTRDAWLAQMRSALADVDAVVRDLLRRPADRELGPVYHRQIYADSAAKIAELLDSTPDVERGDPAGSGDAGPVA
jgi:hypothetical protein